MKTLEEEIPSFKANDRTYQSLAVGCKRMRDGLQLLDEMKVSKEKLPGNDLQI